MKKRILALVLTLALALTLVPTTFAAGTTVPSDIDASSSRAAILELYNYGGLNGLMDNNGRFFPAAICSRASFAGILANLYKGQGVVESSWYESTNATQGWCTDVMTAVSGNLGHRVTWSGGNRSATITRADACEYIVGMLNCDVDLRSLITGTKPGTPATPSQPTQPTTQFIDVPADSYFAKPVAWAVERGITSGTSRNTFSPDTVCTVAQVQVFLQRLYGTSQTLSGLGLLDDRIDPTTVSCTRGYLVWCLWHLAGQPQVDQAYGKGFTDVPATASYATAVRWAMAHGITSGTSSTTFSPMKQVNRAEAVTFLYRAYGPYAV